MEVTKQVVDVKAVRGAESGSYHNLVLMKVKLKSQVRKKNSGRQDNQHIWIDRLKHEEVRREYQAAVERKCEIAKAKGYMSREDVEKAWNELKEGIVGTASIGCEGLLEWDKEGREEVKLVEWGEGIGEEKETDV